MKDKYSKVSVKQLMSLLFLAFMMPASRLIPQRTAALAGDFGWVAVFLSIIPISFFAWIAAATLSSRKDGEGMADIILKVFGKGPGKCVLILYVMWTVLLISNSVRFYGERFLSTTYKEASLDVFVVAMFVLAAYIIRKKFSFFARASQIYFWILVATITAVFLFAAKDVRIENIYPALPESGADVFAAILTVVSTASWGVHITFLTADVRKETDEKKTVIKWTTAIIAVFGIINTLITGVFSSGAVQSLQVPFLMLIKNINVLKVFERIDAVIVAIWTVTDLCYAVLLAFAASEILKKICDLNDVRDAMMPFLLFCFAGALLLPEVFVLEQFSFNVTKWVNLGLGFGMVIIIFAIGKVRKLL